MARPAWSSLFGCFSSHGASAAGRKNKKGGGKKKKVAAAGSNKPGQQRSLQRRLSFSDLSGSALGGMVSPEDLSLSLAGSNLHVFTIAELRAVTRDFSMTNFIGEGGFGPVYKGYVDEKVKPGLCAQPVAVKLLDLEGTQGHNEWLVIEYLLKTNYYAAMPQGDYIELHQKRHGRRPDFEERKRKREAREVHKRSRQARELLGAKGKRFAKKRYAEKAQMKKTLKMHDESTTRNKVDDDVQEGALPPYLLDRDQTQRAKVLSNTIKQKRKEKAGKWDVPLPKVRPVAEEEMFKVLRTGKRKAKQWKRMVTKATFVGPGFTRKPPKYERFIRPTGLRFTKAHVTHPELKCTFNLDIISVKKNPNGPMYTSLGVMTKGTIIEVNVSELGLVTPAGKVVWGKYAQVTNNPENDGCINAVLLV